MCAPCPALYSMKTCSLFLVCSISNFSNLEMMDSKIGTIHTLCSITSSTYDTYLSFSFYTLYGVQFHLDGCFYTPFHSLLPFLLHCKSNGGNNNIAQVPSNSLVWGTPILPNSEVVQQNRLILSSLCLF